LQRQGENKQINYKLEEETQKIQSHKAQVTFSFPNQSVEVPHQVIGGVRKESSNNS